MKKSKTSYRRPAERPRPAGRPQRDQRAARDPRAPRDAALPKGRAVAGVHAVRELIQVRPRAVEAIWFKEGFESNAELADLANQIARGGPRPRVVNVGQLDRVVSVHQGVVAFSTEDPELSFAKLVEKEHATLVVLDEVEDPHNLGAVLRTGWLFGIDGVLTPEARAASLSPTVSKVARGGAEHVPVMRDTGVAESLKYLKDKGFWVFGLAAGGTKTLYDLEIPDKVIWALGSEASGLRKPIARACDELVSIPQIDAHASFNVSVAAALALGETFRQRTHTRREPER